MQLEDTDFVFLAHASGFRYLTCALVCAHLADASGFRFLVALGFVRASLTRRVSGFSLRWGLCAPR